MAVVVALVVAVALAVTVAVAVVVAVTTVAVVSGSGKGKGSVVPRVRVVEWAVAITMAVIGNSDGGGGNTIIN